MGRGVRGVLTGAVIVAAVLFGAPEAAGAESRGLTIKVRASEAGLDGVARDLELYRASYALVIGIDDYTGGWPRLSNAVKDAGLVAEALRRKGFDVSLKTNLTASRLQETLRHFFIVKGADEDARLFVWFAGHGHSQGGEGFLVPADAPKPDAGARFLLSVVPMRDFGTYVRLARSKHVFAVFDSCFAGTVFDSQRALPPASITRATALPVRQFLTSGDAEQTVSDDGTFRELFVRALDGEEPADANGDGYVTATEMGLFLADRMTNLTRTRQTPRYGKLRDKDYDRGDFVFALAEPAVAALSPPPPPPAPGGTRFDRREMELAFWNAVKDSDDPERFKAYVAQFPNGTFASLARLKLGELEGAVPPTGFAVEAVDQDYFALKNANVRAGPSTTARRIGGLGRGARVAVTGRATIGGETWYRVDLGPGRSGYVFASLLKDSDAAEWTLWQKIRTSRNPQHYVRFIERFPDGRFTGEARANLERLRIAGNRGRAEGRKFLARKRLEEQRRKDLQAEERREREQQKMILDVFKGILRAIPRD